MDLRLVRSAALVAALVGALAVAGPAARAQDKSGAGSDKEKAAKEKRGKELTKAKEDLEKKFKGKKENPAPALSFLSTLVESGGLDVSKAKGLLDKTLAKKIPWDEACRAADEAIGDNPKDPKKVEKDLGDWITKWKPKPAPPPADPKAGGTAADPKPPAADPKPPVADPKPPAPDPKPPAADPKAGEEKKGG